MLKKLKLGAAIVGVLGIAIFGAWGYAKGNGTVTIISPSDRDVVVSEGDKVLGKVSSGANARFGLPQGEHKITLRAEGLPETTHSINIENGLYTKVLPIGRQCFAEFDVTNYWYSGKKRLLDRVAPPILVTERVDQQEPFSEPSSKLSLDDLPEKIKANEKAKVFLPIACQVPPLSDDALIAATFAAAE